MKNSCVSVLLVHVAITVNGGCHGNRNVGGRGDGGLTRTVEGNAKPGGEKRSTFKKKRENFRRTEYINAEENVSGEAGSEMDGTD